MHLHDLIPRLIHGEFRVIELTSIHQFELLAVNRIIVPGVRSLQGKVLSVAELPGCLIQFSLWFRADRAVLIIAGRTESYQYSYYFASGYEGKGYNVLVIDNRCHGDSDGRINRLGYGEYKDIIEWCRLLGRLGNKAVVLHGICIGASTALFAAVSEKCPDNVAAVVTEGMYVNFYESLKNHILEKKKPLFPILQGTAVHLFFISRANVVTDGPIKRIKKMRRPILMIQSRQDTYSLPELAQKLYDACPSENKKLVYFPVGAHSRVRINDERGYDEVVHAFLNKTLG